MADFVDQIVAGLQRPGKTQAGLAHALKTHPNVIGKIVKRTREVREREIAIIRHYLELDMVRVVGLAGRNGDRVSFALDPNVGEHDVLGTRVKAPEGATPATVALYVDGDSLGLAMQGSLLFYNDIRQQMDMIQPGWFCVVGMPDDSVRLRIPVRGDRGLWHLHPFVPGTMLLNQEPQWASPLLPSYGRKIRPGT